METNKVYKGEEFPVIQETRHKNVRCFKLIKRYKSNVCKSDVDRILIDLSNSIKKKFKQDKSIHVSDWISVHRFSPVRVTNVTPSSFVVKTKCFNYQKSAAYIYFKLVKHGTIIRTGITCKKIPL